MLRAQGAGDAGAAWAAYRHLGELRAQLAAERVTVAEGVLDPFLDRARKAYESWAGLAREPAGTAGGPGTLRLEVARVLDTVTVLTDPGTRGAVEVRTAGGSWRRIGALTAGARRNCGWVTGRWTPYGSWTRTRSGSGTWCRGSRTSPTRWWTCPATARTPTSAAPAR